ncbi:hypothetical protein HanHA300_Chr13g0480641 [Helianthus annuus]|nr:hypothetical protein HanHA300_Chr13g0480641 [Helianthus annuus]
MSGVGKTVCVTGASGFVASNNLISSSFCFNKDTPSKPPFALPAWRSMTYVLESDDVCFYFCLFFLYINVDEGCKRTELIKSELEFFQTLFLRLKLGSATRTW